METGCLSEVNDSYVRIGFVVDQHHVFGLEVAVHEALRLHVVHHRHDGADDPGRVRFRVSFPAHNGVEQLPTLAQLQNQEHVLHGYGYGYGYGVSDARLGHRWQGGVCMGGGFRSMGEVGGLYSARFSVLHTPY